MRFAQIEVEGRRGLAILDGSGLRGLTEGDKSYPGSIQDLLTASDLSLEQAYQRLLKGRDFELENVSFLPPLLQPNKIICVGLNYRDHTAESDYEQPIYPTFFSRFSSSLVGHGAAIVRPEASDTLDYEGELVAVIGKGGRHITPAAALDHVAGFSIFNDASIREFQHRTPQWTIGKNFDKTGGFGPWLITSDEVPAGGGGLRIETRLNGKIVQAANTDDLIFDVPTLIVTVSAAMTLAPGDIIVTGTPAGVGHARNPKLYMKPGDTCEVEIERVGVLRNQVVDEAARESEVSKQVSKRID